MVQLIAVGLVGGLGWYAYRAFKRQMEIVSNELKEAEKKRESGEEMAALEMDKDGVYRPKKNHPKSD